MQMTPLIAVHMTAALGAVAIGPIALWARRARAHRPRLHRAFGYAWVTLMIAAAVSALFIRDHALPNIAGYTPLHLLVPMTLLSLFGAFYKLARGDIRGHRRIMQGLYIGACVVAGGFTLMPDRYLGRLVRQTPTWVWGLLAALLALAALQLRDRRQSLLRVSIMPVAMTLFSAWGTWSAFGSSPLLGQAVAVWAAAAALVFALVARGRAAASYDAATRSYDLPGSAVPLLLVAGIFLVKYGVGIELAMAPRLLHDTQYALTVAGLYGAFTGSFVGRACRPWRLALPMRTVTAPA